MSLLIAPASEEEVAILAVLHVEGWHSAYAGAVDQDFLNSMSVHEREIGWEKWLSNPDINAAIAYVQDHPVGFVSYSKVETMPPGQSTIRPQYTSEILAIYILPDYWKQGVGKALMSYAAEKLKDNRQSGVCLWVLDKNKNACSFYEKMGGQRIGKHMIEIGPSKVKEVCYGWRNLKDLIK
ncbi:MAG: GNAT family N-acetyltransferase [Alphaproteobacteria bacterium]|nr:GNAT family N-acetyltransferase [Alphaproteobacteria bacterium]